MVADIQKLVDPIGYRLKEGRPVTPELEIIKVDFQAYEEVRASGVTNMWDVTTVEELSGLDRDTISAIIRQYSELNKQYPDVRK